MSLSKNASDIINNQQTSGAPRGTEYPSMENVTYFSSYQGRKVVDSEGRSIGKVRDFVITPGESLLEVSRIVFTANILGDSVIVPMSSVDSIDREIRLKTAREEMPPGKLSDHEMLVTETILDKQIVDIDGLKVVRVNDVLMTKKLDKLCIVGVDVGFKGILRRLGLSWFNSYVLSAMPDQLIAWSFIDPLDPDLRRIHLKIPRKRVGDLHPADIADILEELDRREQLLILESLSDEKAAETLEEVEPDVQAQIVKNMESDEVADLLENMNPDDAADVINMMSEERAREVLKLMDVEDANDVRELLEYGHKSAGGLMTNDFVTVSSSAKITDVFAKLRELGNEIDMIYYVYVLDEHERLNGIMSLRDLLLARPEQSVSEVMKTDLFTVSPETGEEEVATLLSKYDLLAIPVLDNDGVMLGVVTFDDAMYDIMPEEVRKQLPRNYRMIRKAHRSSNIDQS